MLVMGPHWRSLFFEVIYMVGLLPLGASPRLCFSMAFHGLKAVVKHDWRTSGTPCRYMVFGIEYWEHMEHMEHSDGVGINTGAE